MNNILFNSIKIGNSHQNSKIIDIDPNINIDDYIIFRNDYPDKFKYTIKDGKLYVKRLDTTTGWGQELTLLKHTIKPKNYHIPKIIFQTYLPLK